MGTSNFYSLNAKNVYAVLLDKKDEENGEIINCDEIDYQNLKEFLNDCLIEVAKKYKKEYYVDEKILSRRDLRSFPSTSLGCFYSSKETNYYYAAIKLNLFIRSGYYEGANLDYEFEFSLNNYISDELPEIADIEAELEDAYEINGIATITAPKVFSWFETELNKLIELVEKVYLENSKPLSVQGRFSNGEVIYQEIKNNN